MEDHEGDEGSKPRNDAFWRALRQIKKEADRVARPSVIASFRDWEELLSSSDETPATESSATKD